jgi:hypothetical protein
MDYYKLFWDWLRFAGVEVPPRAALQQPARNTNELPDFITGKLPSTDDSLDRLKARMARDVPPSPSRLPWETDAPSSTPTAQSTPELAAMFSGPTAAPASPPGGNRKKPPASSSSPTLAWDLEGVGGQAHCLPRHPRASSACDNSLPEEHCFPPPSGPACCPTAACRWQSYSRAPEPAEGR